VGERKKSISRDFLLDNREWRREITVFHAARGILLEAIHTFGPALVSEVGRSGSGRSS
jgi:hypothetical protein